MHFEVLKLREVMDERPIIDVRSPSEYQKGHIPGAISFPLFTDEERAKVGTLYKRRGKRSAVTLGLKLLGPKLADLTRQAYHLANDNRIALYCWRGGMRSNAMGWLLETAGLEVSVLTGGYKSFRQEVLRSLGQDGELIVLGGPTGSGKTKVLHELRALGVQVIDLEGLARHKGSAFGNLNDHEQPSTEHFANLIWQEWSNFDFSKPIWIEDESPTIGSVWLPEVLYHRIRDGHIAWPEIPRSERAAYLAQDYGDADVESLKSGFEKISKRLGGQNVQAAIEAIERGELTAAADLALTYYDKAYEYGLDRREGAKLRRFRAPGIGPVKIARAICRWKIQDFYE